ncbi:amidase [Salinisphaera orenii MK-B5]|uniref:Amidase n=1 Tax=Salinisphaera orenii MK-B5 TaxID=856730 RepID=A0A423PF66_9GAMM|nr:amidase [Salinisphaera orenii]ROO24237.1 amidase [Salinisphaera orenii MK-B5]
METKQETQSLSAVEEIVGLGATALSNRIAAGAVSCREVMSAYLTHIDAVNPRVNAIVSRRRADVLLAEADARDRELADGIHRGWLHGIPQAVKDLTPTADVVTTLGSPLFADAKPTQDGLMVERMKAAGAIIIGKTNTPEFGLGSQTYNPVFGTTRNAYDHDLTAGGSSGGAAAALAMRMLPVADGSDMMGSLRNPAAFNNVFGFRPSFGRVPQVPAPDVFGQQLGTEGPMGRSVADVARLLAIQAGPDPRVPLSIAEAAAPFADEPYTEVAGLRIGWIGDWGGYLPMEAGILDVCEQALGRLETIGCIVEPTVPAFDPARLWRCWNTLRQWAVAGKLAPLHDDPHTRDRLKPEACWEVEHGLALSALDIHRANVERSAWYQTLRGAFERFDVLAMPSAQVFAFDADTHWPAAIAGHAMDTYHRWMEVVIGASLAGVPAMNVPAGFDERGRAMGLQLIGPHRADLDVLRLAAAYERVAADVLSHTPVWR